MRPKGLAKTGGRKPGSVNVFSSNIKNVLSEHINDAYVKSIFEEIERIESLSERVRMRLKILEFIVPKPKEQPEIEKENEFRKVFLERIFPKKD